MMIGIETGGDSVYCGTECPFLGCEHEWQGSTRAYCRNPVVAGVWYTEKRLSMKNGRPNRSKECRSLLASEYKFDPSLYPKIDLLVQKDRETGEVKRTEEGEELYNPQGGYNNEN